ncbi:DCC1-like thiol-disulfide oxidoreductase family protein [Halorutilales archaeon Cl-col2-1]
MNPDSVIIYDGECPFCSTASRALERLEDVGAVSWYDDEAQWFLEAEFGETPFVLFLVDSEEGKVYAGGDAAEELADRAGLPGLVGDLLGDRYETVSEVIRKVTRTEGSPESFDGVYEIEDEANDLFDELAEVSETAEDRRRDTS